MRWPAAWTPPAGHAPLLAHPQFLRNIRRTGQHDLNLTIHDSSGDNVGLFGQIAPSGVIENVGLAGVNVVGSDALSNVGGLAGLIRAPSAARP
jgi:hypothetical protein